MQFNEVKYDDALPIDGYGDGFFRIAGQVHQGAVFIFQGRKHSFEQGELINTLAPLANEIDVIFFGCGKEIQSFDTALGAPLASLPFGYELMITPTACRMYNVLLSEGRRVAIAALPV